MAQLAIAWVLSRGPDIVPLIGSRRRSQLAEAVPPEAAAGERYSAHQMAQLDSERRGGGKARHAGGG